MDADESRPSASKASVASSSAAAAASMASLLDDDARPSDRGGYHRKHGNQGPNSHLWRAHKKHFFILSSAGKPIYTRYGDETKLLSLMGVIHAIISVFAEDGDPLRSIHAGEHLFVFASRGPLNLVAVSCTGESESHLRRQLDLIYNQIALTLTSAQLTRIFDQRVNFDLRSLLSGTEVFMDNLCKTFQHEPGVFLNAVRCRRMPVRLRDHVNRALVEAGPPKQILFAILLVGNELVAMMRPKNHSIHPNDMHLLINMIMSSSSFRNAESWTPVCLPIFNDRGFLHAYICYLSGDLCLVLLSTDKDAFFALSDYKRTFSHILETGSIMQELEESTHARPYNVLELEIPGLRHFLYTSRVHGQYTEAIPVQPYTRGQDKKRLLRLYEHAMAIASGRRGGSAVASVMGGRQVCLCTGADTVVLIGTGTGEVLAAGGPMQATQGGVERTAAGAAAAASAASGPQFFAAGVNLAGAPSSAGA